jgi:transposase
MIDDAADQLRPLEAMRDRRAVARYAGLTGSPDESGTKRREKGLARSAAWGRRVQANRSAPAA